MSKIAFIAKRFNTQSVARIAQCDAIIEDYQGQGLRLTLRQLYYQLVSRNLIRNTEREYKNLVALVSDARLAGLLDWDAIEDRVRRPRSPSEFENLSDLVEAAIASYRLPRWQGQDYYVELWVEKDALAGVLEPLASEFHVTMMVNRGYSSTSAMYESANRFRHYSDRTGVLFYLGDHDPSGEDMVRDMGVRLQMFGVDVDVRKLALTMPQIEQYNPPPNPAKMADPRAEAYVEAHGNESWEVDALPPNVLTQIIRDAFDEVLDVLKMNRIKKREQRDKRQLQVAVERLTR